MKTTRCAPVLAFVSLLPLAPVATAQPAAPLPDSWGRVVGNWDLEQKDDKNRTVATGKFSFQPGNKQNYGHARSSGLVQEVGRGYRELPCDKGTFDGTNVVLGCFPYGFTHAMGEIRLRVSEDGNTLRGDWGGTREKPAGLIRMKRTTPVIESVELLDNGWGLDWARMKQEWAKKGAAPPSIRLRVRGKDLPLWAHVYAEPVINATIDDPELGLVQEHRRMSINARVEREKKGVMEFPLEVLPRAKPGRKVLTINGARKEFDLELANWTADSSGKLKGLRYVELKDGKFVPVAGEIKHGAAFYVEATFEAKPAKPDYTVKLNWGEGAGADVVVKASDDAKVYRSEPIRLQPPVAKP